MQQKLGSPRPFILWLLGVPGSGKSTISKLIARCIISPKEIIDSDEIRIRLTPTPSWSESERALVYRAIWEVATTLHNHDVSSIIAASAGGINIDEFRQDAPMRTFYVHLNCDLEIAASRHPKQLYHSASQRSDIKLPILRTDATGVISPSDIEFSKRRGIPGYTLILPRSIDLEVDTNSKVTLQDDVNKILNLLQ